MTSAWNIADLAVDADVKIHADIRRCGAPILITLCIFKFKLQHVDYYYLGPIATTILMLNLKVNLKYMNEMSFK